MTDRNERKAALRLRHAELLVSEGHQPNVDDALAVLDAIELMVGESFVPTRYAVICPDHGRVFLMPDEYERQMNRPNSLWSCPRWQGEPADIEAGQIGLCGRASEFDDDVYEAGEEATP